MEKYQASVKELPDGKLVPISCDSETNFYFQINSRIRTLLFELDRHAGWLLIIGCSACLLLALALQLWPPATLAIIWAIPFYFSHAPLAYNPLKRADNTLQNINRWMIERDRQSAPDAQISSKK